MKRLALMGLVVAATAAVVAGPGLAQDKQPGPGNQDIAKEFADQIKELKLTGEQQAKIDQIMETFRQAAANWRNEHGADLEAARKKFQDARQSGDPAAMKDAGEKLRELLKGRIDALQALKTQIEEVLTAEQKEKAKAVFEKFADRIRANMPGGGGGPGGPGGRLGGELAAELAALKLTEDQKTQIRKILGDAAEKIRTDVLTEDQRKELAKLREQRGAAPGGAGPMLDRILQGLSLTDEQKKKIDDIRKEAADKAAKAEPQDRRAIMQEATRKIADEVLTEAQREQFRKKMQEGRGPRQPAGPGKGAPPKTAD